MSETLDRIRVLVTAGRARISDHGYEQLLDDDILATDVLSGAAAAAVVEDYPNAAHGPSVLVLQHDRDGRPLHPRGHSGGTYRSSRRRDRLSTRSCAVVRGLPETEAEMTRKTTKIIHEGGYAAEVPVELIEDDTAWSPYLSLDDAKKLDAVRIALKAGDVASAAKHGRIFELHPVS